ncbi:hypothetical protein ACLOJK_021312 [Asimina triloba]
MSFGKISQDAIDIEKEKEGEEGELPATGKGKGPMVTPIDVKDIPEGVRGNLLVRSSEGLVHTKVTKKSSRGTTPVGGDSIDNDELARSSVGQKDVALAEAQEDYSILKVRVEAAEEDQFRAREELDEMQEYLDKVSSESETIPSLDVMASLDGVGVATTGEATISSRPIRGS